MISAYYRSSHQRAFSLNININIIAELSKQHQFLDPKYRIATPKYFYDKQEQWLEVKENHRVESPREARSASMEARSNRVTPARLVSRLALRNFHFSFLGGLRMDIGAVEVLDRSWSSPSATPPSRVNLRSTTANSSMEQLQDRKSCARDYIIEDCLDMRRSSIISSSSHATQLSTNLRPASARRKFPASDFTQGFLSLDLLFARAFLSAALLTDTISSSPAVVSRDF